MRRRHGRRSLRGGRAPSARAATRERSRGRSATSAMLRSEGRTPRRICAAREACSSAAGAPASRSAVIAVTVGAAPWRVGRRRRRAARRARRLYQPPPPPAAAGRANASRVSSSSLDSRARASLHFHAPHRRRRVQRGVRRAGATLDARRRARTRRRRRGSRTRDDERATSRRIVVRRRSSQRHQRARAELNRRRRRSSGVGRRGARRRISSSEGERAPPRRDRAVHRFTESDPPRAAWMPAPAQPAASPAPPSPAPPKPTFEHGPRSRCSGGAADAGIGSAGAAGDEHRRSRVTTDGRGTRWQASAHAGVCV